MSLLEHLEELRQRLIRTLVALLVGMLVCFYWAQPIFHFLAEPIYKFLPPGSKLAFMGVTDPFMLYFKTALLAGTFLAFPAILYQFWRFVAPGLYQRERRWLGPFILLGWFFFLLGGAFAYYVAFPYAVQFLLEMGKEFQPVIAADRYLSLLLTIVLGLGLMFELPIVIVLACQVGIVTPGFLMKHFRWAVLIIFILSAIITPTQDIFNMCLFALPTLLLYLLGVGAAWIFARRKRARAAAVSPA